MTGIRDEGTPDCNIGYYDTFDLLITFEKKIVILSLNLKRYFTCGYGGLKIIILANLGQLTRDIFRAINA